MADIHILKQDIDIKTAQCVFHVPIPTGTNSAGVAWRDAVVADQGGSDAITSVLSTIDQTELTQLKAGALVEFVQTVRFSSINLTNAQRLQQIKDEYNETKTEFVANKQIELAFFGWSGAAT